MKATLRPIEYDVKFYPAKNEYVVTLKGNSHSYSAAAFHERFELKDEKPAPEYKAEDPSSESDEE